MRGGTPQLPVTSTSGAMLIPTPSVIESVCRGVKRARSARFTPRQTATLQTDSVSDT